MNRFLQLHLLTVYPPSNPNRDDLGNPKSVLYGNTLRLRISSQALKRAIRTSDLFQEGLSGHLGQRTKRVGRFLLQELNRAYPDQQDRIKQTVEWVVGAFGKPDPEHPGHIRQLAFISTNEKQAALALAHEYMQSKEIPNGKVGKRDRAELLGTVLRQADSAVDIGMFGRMLADATEYNREAAVQLSHAFTTHKAIGESDYFVAADDLMVPEEGKGVGHLDMAGFGSGVYYTYGCVNRSLLLHNLDGDRDLARRSIVLLVEAIATVSPTGKRNSFAHHSRASYLLAELGNQQPRSLAAAFVSPVQGNDLLGDSIESLKRLRDEMDQAYGPCADQHAVMDITAQTGTLQDVASFAAQDI